MFADARAAIAEQRILRLRALPLDPQKIGALTTMLIGAMRNFGPDVHCFQGYTVVQGEVPAETSQEFRVNGIDKGDFVTPSIAAVSVNDLNDVIVDSFRQVLAQYLWSDFHRRPRETLEVGMAGYPQSYWTAVTEKLNAVGPAPSILAGHDPIGETVSDWLIRPDNRIPGHEAAYQQGHDSGWGSGYVGTVGGVDVYASDFPADKSILYSATMLQSIVYRPVTDGGTLLTVELEEHDDPFHCTVVARFCQCTTWSQAPVIEISLRE
jgi:hypothetical protein